MSDSVSERSGPRSPGESLFRPSTPPPTDDIPESPRTPTTPTRWKRKSKQNLKQEDPELEPSYWTLPNKGQIFLLVICRITEPLAYASISPYIYYMIRDFGYTDPSHISVLVTLVTTSFSFGQAVSAVHWGKFADIRGRKPALLLGLLGTAISILIFGTATNIYWAMAGRMMSGLLNGNIGVMRTMVAEFIGDKKQYQTRAFAILPITMNVGTIVGPMIGGLLADPATNYPWLFGDSQFLKKYPYILPNLFPIPFIVVALCSSVLFIEETLDTHQALMPRATDRGLQLGNAIKCWLRRRNHDYEPIEDSNFGTIGSTDSDDELILSELEEDEFSEDESLGIIASSTPQVKTSEPVDEPVDRSLKAILTKPVRITLACYIILMLHCPTFMQLLPLFLSTPRMDDKGNHTNPIMFNGGLGLKTSEIGLIISVLGCVGVSLQLMVYPRLAAYFGNARLHRIALTVFPASYFLMPYLSFIPASPEILATLGTIALATVVILGRTFAIPPMTILITNAAPSKRVLGTVHGLTHSVTSTARCVGPFILGNLYSLGVRVNMISLAWWIMAVIVIVENFVARDLKEWGTVEGDWTA
jgi:MFS family permease